MNKLVLGSNNLLENTIVDVEYSSDVLLKIQDKVVIHDIKNFGDNLKVELSNKSSLEYYQVREIEEMEGKKDYTVTIDIHDDCKISYHLVLINSGTNKVNININMLGNNSYADVLVRAINKKEKDALDLTCTGFIEEKTKDNELVENLKGLIIKDDTIKISPIIKAHTNEVVANHLVTVGSFNKEDLFYLLSRGLSLDSAKKLLQESFIKQILSTYEIERGVEYVS